MEKIILLYIEKVKSKFPNLKLILLFFILYSISFSFILFSSLIDLYKVLLNKTNEFVFVKDSNSFSLKLFNDFN